MTYQQAFHKYGKATCQRAHQLNRDAGEGANTIGQMLDLTTRQADAAISAWDEFLQTVPGTDQAQA
jgi:hypothetical protein